MEDTLFEFLNQHMTISDNEKKAITDLNVFKSFQKDDILIKEGEYTNEYYFVIKGCIRCYFLVDGEEKTSAFYTELDSFVPQSTVEKKSSALYASCVEDSLIVVSTPEMENAVFEKFPRFETLCRILSEKVVIKKQVEFECFKNSSAEQRYLNLLQNRPDLIQRVPQYHLASYLGIKPESLSRIRKRLATNK
jgi:CRP-like cAMP-binding protein